MMLIPVFGLGDDVGDRILERCGGRYLPTLENRRLTFHSQAVDHAPRLKLARLDRYQVPRFDSITHVSETLEARKKSTWGFAEKMQRMTVRFVQQNGRIGSRQKSRHTANGRNL